MITPNNIVDAKLGGASKEEIQAMQQQLGKEVKSKAIVVNREMDYDSFEDMIVTALEGGSNYWYMIDLDNSTGFTKKYADDPRLKSIRIADALYNNEDSSVVVLDTEDEEETLGTLTYQSVRKTLENFPKDHQWALDNVLNGDYDANDADVVFQVLVMGDVVYG
jgi:hypothetical protein